jgi:hypothetical protein
MALVDHVPRGTTAQLCVQPPARTEVCGETALVAWHTPPLPTARTAGPSSYSWPPGAGVVHGETSLLVEGLDGSALTALAVIVRSPGRSAARIEVANPTPREDRCACGDQRSDPIRIYDYRMAAVQGPLVPSS